MKCYLIRHTSVNVPKGVCYGQTNVEVAASFSQEAKLVAQQLHHLTFDYVFTSPLDRCTQLAHYCGYTDALSDERLQELNFGDWEMQLWEEINDPHLAKWYHNWVDEKATNGESLLDLYLRFTSFITSLPNDAKQIALFTHGGVINCARIYAGSTTFERAVDETPGYGSVTIIDIVRHHLA